MPKPLPSEFVQWVQETYPAVTARTILDSAERDESITYAAWMAGRKFAEDVAAARRRRFKAIKPEEYVVDQVVKNLSGWSGYVERKAMEVTLNVLFDHSKLSGVREALDRLEGITAVDTGLVLHGVLVIHTERRNAKHLKEELQKVEGVLSTQLGAVAAAI